MARTRAALMFLIPVAKVTETVSSRLRPTSGAARRPRAKPAKENAAHAAKTPRNPASRGGIFPSKRLTFMAITAVRKIFDRGFKAGFNTRGALPSLRRFKATPATEGRTTMRTRERNSPPVSIATALPMKSEMVAGTVNGASRVSMSYNFV